MYIMENKPIHNGDKDENHSKECEFSLRENTSPEAEKKQDDTANVELTHMLNRGCTDVSDGSTTIRKQIYPAVIITFGFYICQLSSVSHI